MGGPAARALQSVRVRVSGEGGSTRSGGGGPQHRGEVDKKALTAWPSKAQAHGVSRARERERERERGGVEGCVGLLDLSGTAARSQSTSPCGQRLL